jgi:hypothetical protein
LSRGYDFLIAAPQRHYERGPGGPRPGRPYYVAECGPAWHGTPGAVEWLTKTITAAPPNQPFNAIVALFAVALVMVSTTRAEPPRLTAAATLPYGELARAAAPVAVIVGAR